MVYVAVGLLVLLLAWAVVYVRFTLTDESAWKRELHLVVTRIERDSKQIRQQLQQVINQRADFRRLQQSDFLTHVFTLMPVTELLEYPGIGDATINRLKHAGIETITQLRRRDITTIDGLGNARTRDLQSALKALETSTAKKLTNPNDPLVQQYRTLATERDRQFEIEQQRLEQSRRHAEGTLNFLHARREFAKQLTWFNFLLGRMPTLTAEQQAESFELPQTVPSEQPMLALQASVQPAATTVTPPPSPSLPAPPPVASIITPEDILRAVAMLGLAIAKADGRVAASERKQLALFLERRFAESPTLKALFGPLSETETASIPPLEVAIADVRRLVPSPQHHDVYLMVKSVADAAGGINAKESAALKLVEAALDTKPPVHTPSNEIPVLPARTPSAEITEASARETLEIALTTPLSIDLIRRQYRLLTERYDSSRLNQMDAEFRQLADSKRKSVLLAAEWLIKPFGEPLVMPDAPKPVTADRHNPDLDAIFGD